MPHSLSRRAILAAAPLAAALSTPAFGATLAKGAFTHAVASGDPTATSVILWTRFVPADGKDGAVGWEVAKDEAFRSVVAKGEAIASIFSGWCVKVDAQGLQPGRRYFYRFTAASGASPVGRTRTAPAGAADALTFALFSCSNKPFGYFRAYAHAAAREDIDLCVHVGDYIYEYGRGNYPSPSETVASRAIEPDSEIVTLPDYHARYASYRSDPDLQELHRVKPFMTVWDDHELTNDAWRDGAQNHQPETEGDWTVRRVLAAKAYADWMPIRPQSSLVQIYRRLDWGTLASFIMLDTRLIGRDKQYDWRAALAPAMADGEAAVAKAAQAFARDQLGDPKRTLLGADQEAWTVRELQRSKARGATWQVLAQQLVMANQIAPAALPGMLGDDASASTKSWIAAGAGLGRMGLGWNLDSWSGYLAARERLLGACAQHASNALVLAGDSHNAWFSSLTAKSAPGRVAALEMAGGSVTSPGFERTFTKAAGDARETAFRDANSELGFCDVSHRGYATATLTPKSATTEWVAFSGVAVADAPVSGIVKGAAEARAAGGPSRWAFS